MFHVGPAGTRGNRILGLASDAPARRRGMMMLVMMMMLMMMTTTIAQKKLIGLQSLENITSHPKQEPANTAREQRSAPPACESPDDDGDDEDDDDDDDDDDEMIRERLPIRRSSR